MGFYVAKQSVKKMIALGKQILHAKALVMGATFKENVSDIRNSKVADVISELKSYGVKVDVVDPHASSEELKHEYGFELIKDYSKKKYDLVIVAVNHAPYLEFDETFFKSIMTENGVLFDVKSIYRNKMKNINYLSL